MDGAQGEYSQEYDIKPSNMCLCDSQYVYGKNTNIYAVPSKVHMVAR